MNETILIIGMMLVTFAIRYPILAVSEQVNLPDEVLRLLNYVPPTVLTAIVVPAVLMPEGTLSLDHTNARLVGAVVAVLVGLRQRNLLLTIVSSMGVFFAWQVMLSVF